MYWNILFFPVYLSFSFGMSKWARHDKSLEYGVMYVAKHLRHWIAHFIFKINRYERMTSITKYRVYSMHSKSVFIYFSITMYIVGISQSTSAPSVDNHSSNRDVGTIQGQVHSSCWVFTKVIYKWFPFHLDLCNYSYLDNTNACYVRYVDLCIVYLETYLYVLLDFLTTVSFKNKTPMSTY